MRFKRHQSDKPRTPSNRIHILLLAGGGLILIAAALALYFLYLRPHVAITPSHFVFIPKEQPKPRFFAPLTGVEIANTSDATKPVTAIMIENSPEARPQSGLKDAEVVYEAIAEGGITRFLALYQQNKPQLIGPVRSVRMYYVDWLARYNASVAHVGGSAAALREVRNGSYRDIDQFFNGSSYWRATDRYAPHNVYTSFERLDALNAKKGYTSSNPQVLKRADSTPSETPNATSIAVKMSSASFNSSYTYDAATNTYLRSQAGRPHLDREHGQIAPRVVVVIKAAMQHVLEDGYREQYQTTGNGSAVIFQDGTAQEVTWHRNDQKGQYTFTNGAGEEVSLARGQTWISVVPATTGGVTWQ
jgi:hypothetical protein